MTALRVNGLDTEHEDAYTATIHPDTEGTHRCKACGLALDLDITFEAVDNPYRIPADQCIDTDLDDNDNHDEHDPEPIPLSWLNHAGVQLDPDNDRVTLHISVGDERGAFTFTVERIDNPGHENHGRLLMFQPKANDTGWPPQHETLTQINDGAFLIGEG